MTAPFKTIEGGPDIAGRMRQIGREAKLAARVLALAPTPQKDAALAAMAEAIRAGRERILAANREDIAEAKAAGTTAAFLDRLALDEKRVAAMADGIEIVRGLKDPVGTAFWDSAIVAAARALGCDRVYTEDLNHGQVIEGLTIIDPFR